MEEILYCLQAAFEHDFTADEVNGHIDAIRAKYGESRYAIEVVKINNGYQFLTKKQYPPGYQPAAVATF
jgi:segregation and condensation protein B